MLDFFWLINVRLLLRLNHWLATDEKLFALGIFLTDHVADALTIATFALLWFWPQARDVALFQQVSSRDSRSLVARVRQGLHSIVVCWMTVLSRTESRAQFLVLAFAGVVGYVTARLIAFQLDLNRPFSTYLDVRTPLEGAFDGLRTYGSFPSDHAVLLAMLPVALLYWDRGLALFWGVLGVFLAAVRVAVGFHYPMDMLGGATIGAFYGWFFMSWYRRGGKLYEAANTLARSFYLSNAPYCYLLYFLLFLGGLEFAMHFRHVLETIFTLRAEIQGRFGG